MDANQIIALVGSLGFPICVVLAGMWFAKKDFWPWYTKRIESSDSERKDRHAEYMTNQRNQTTALERIGDVTEQFALTMTKLDDKLTSNHADLVQRLEKLKVVRDTGPLGKVDVK